MEFRIAEERDQDLWDSIVNDSSNGMIFYMWDWLKIVERHSFLNLLYFKARGKLYPLILSEKEKPVGILPLFLFKTPVNNFCYSPPSNVDLLYLGPLFKDLHLLKPEKKQIFLHDYQIMVDSYIRNDLKAGYIQINAPPGFDDCRFFKWSGYSAEPRYTYYINLKPGIDHIWTQFNRSLRQNIEKGKKGKIVVTGGTKDDAFFIRNLLMQRGRIKSSIEFMGEIFDRFFPNHIKVFIAKAGTERLSGIILIIGKEKVSFWIGAPKCSYNGLYPNELLLWEGIRWASEQGFSTFEIIGADDLSLFPFKRKFNGDIIQYYQMKWYSSTFNLFSSLFRHLKKTGNNNIGLQ
jgi:hypothetical protein